jgi:hypothetical protein
MRHPWKKSCTIKCCSPVGGVEDPEIQHEPTFHALRMLNTLYETRRTFVRSDWKFLDNALWL